MPHRQLTMEDRHCITYLHMTRVCPAEIARRLGFHRATICRELARNRDSFDVYHYQSAQRLAEERRSQASRRYKLPSHPPLEAYVRQGLEQNWAPEQISRRLQRDHRRDTKMRVSHETIYRWVYRTREQGEAWHEHLRRRHVRRRKRIVGERQGKRGQIPGRVGIEQRPEAVQDRRRFGDWEIDTVEGGKGQGLILTCVERKSRYVLLGKLADKKSQPLSRIGCAMMKGLPQKLRRTMTADNGKEFTDFKRMEQGLKMKVYFANPHAPWERGTNQNTNGLLRDWLPKGCDMRQVSARELARIQRLMNNRPRKCLNYRTPLEVLNALPGVALQN